MCAVADPENLPPIPDAVSAKAEPLGGARSFHAAILLVSVAVLALSMMLSSSGQTKVVIPLLDVPMPELCTWNRFTGWDCPGCGLTRSFVCLGHGQLIRAFTFNPVGPILFLLMVAQIPYRSAQLVRIRLGKTPFALGKLGARLGIAVLVATLVQWFVRMIWF